MTSRSRVPHISHLVLHFRFKHSFHLDRNRDRHQYPLRYLRGFFPHCRPPCLPPFHLPIQVLQPRRFFLRLPSHRPVSSSVRPQRLVLIRSCLSPLVDVFYALPACLGNHRRPPSPPCVEPSSTQEGTSRLGHSGRLGQVATQDPQLVAFQQRYRVMSVGVAIFPPSIMCAPPLLLRVSPSFGLCGPIVSYSYL
jgi:hypothetical protein